MKILSNDELGKLQEYDEPSDESLGYERNIAKAQHQQDLKDFIEWIELHWVSRSTDGAGTYELLMSDFEKLKQLVEE